MTVLERNFKIPFAATQVDTANRVIRGVAVMTVGEVLGHDCEADLKTLNSVRDCAAVYGNGVKVRIDHGSGVLNIVGAMRGFRLDGEVLRGDLHFFSTAADADHIMELAREIPDTFGLSISFTGPDETKAKRKFARCEELFAVDLVPEPAANPSGLFSRKTTTRNHSMADENEKQDDPISELSKKFDAFSSGVDERLKKLEAPKEEEDKDLEDKKDEELTEEEFGRLMDKHRKFGARLDAIHTLRKFSKPAVSAPETPKTTEAKKDFEALVEEKMKGGMTKTEAIQFCVKKHPTEHKEFTAQGKTRVL